MRRAPIPAEIEARRRARADQNPLTFNRPPVTHSPASDAVGTVLPRIALLIDAALAPGASCRG
jgi:hypothetical protein